MTTKTEATTIGDAPKGARRITDPGLGDKVAPNEEPTKSEKQFDPRRFQANTMPPGLRSVVIGTELPSMPRSRIEDTLPPTDLEEVLGDPPAQQIAGLPRVCPAIATPKTDTPTAIEIPRPISLVPKTSAGPARIVSDAPPPPAEPIRPVSVSPKPIMTAAGGGIGEPKPITEAPPAVQETNEVEGAPLKAISYRLAVPLGILIFAAGALVVLLVSRGRGHSAHVEPPEEISIISTPDPVVPQAANVPPPVQATALVSAAPAVKDVNVDEPAKKRRTTIAPKAQPRVVELPKSNESRARTRNEDPD